jgi:hypothetical protein
MQERAYDQKILYPDDIAYEMQYTKTFGGLPDELFANNISVL